MTNGSGVIFLKNWGAVILMMAGIVFWLATMAGHPDEEDIHKTSKDMDLEYVPREVFDLTIKNFEKDMAYFRKMLDKIDKKLDE